MFIGLPKDNLKTINDTINYAKKINSTYSQFSVWTPYPGTPIYEKFRDKIIANKFEDFDQYQLVYKHELFDKLQIRKLLKKSYNSYYLRLNWIYKYIKSFKCIKK